MRFLILGTNKLADLMACPRSLIMKATGYIGWLSLFLCTRTVKKLDNLYPVECYTDNYYWILAIILTCYSVKYPS